MKDLSRKCIFDGSTDDLNTVMEITLDDEKYKVAVCSGCEDDASPGAIKKVIPDRLAEMEREKAELRAKMEMFKEIAEEMGFALIKKEDLEQMRSGQAQLKPQNRSRPVDMTDKPTVQVGEAQYKMQKNTRRQKADEGMSAEEAAAALEAAKRTNAHTQGYEGATAGEAAPFAKHQIPDKVTVPTPEGGKTVQRPTPGAKKMQTVKGRAGIPTAIPKSLHGSDGETTITIVNTGGDRTLQMRGKQLAQMREYGDQSYYSQSCRPCQGTGLHAKKECRACGGTGIII